jgi:hypothetical protein
LTVFPYFYRFYLDTSTSLRLFYLYFHLFFRRIEEFWNSSGGNSQKKKPRACGKHGTRRCAQVFYARERKKRYIFQSEVNCSAIF